MTPEPEKSPINYSPTSIAPSVEPLPTHKSSVSEKFIEPILPKQEKPSETAAFTEPPA